MLAHLKDKAKRLSISSPASPVSAGASSASSSPDSPDVDTSTQSDACSYITAMLDGTRSAYDAHKDLLAVAHGEGISPLLASQLPRLTGASSERYNNNQFLLDVTHSEMCPDNDNNFPSALRWKTLDEPCREIRSLISLLCADIPVCGHSLVPGQRADDTPLQVLQAWQESVQRKAGTGRAEGRSLSILSTDKALDETSKRLLEKVQTENPGSHLSVVLCTEDKAAVDSWKKMGLDRVFVTERNATAQMSQQRPHRACEYSKGDWALETLICPMLSGWDLKTEQIPAETRELIRLLRKEHYPDGGGDNERQDDGAGLFEKLMRRTSTLRTGDGRARARGTTW